MQKSTSEGLQEPVLYETEIRYAPRLAHRRQRQKWKPSGGHRTNFPEKRRARQPTSNVKITYKLTPEQKLPRSTNSMLKPATAAAHSPPRSAPHLRSGLQNQQSRHLQEVIAALTHPAFLLNPRRRSPAPRCSSQLRLPRKRKNEARHNLPVTNGV